MKIPHQNGASNSDLPPFLTTYENHEKANELPPTTLLCANLLAIDRDPFFPLTQPNIYVSQKRLEEYHPLALTPLPPFSMCNGTTNNTPHFTEEQESCFPMSEWPVGRALPSSSIAHWNKTCDQFEVQTVSDDDRSCTAKTSPQIPTKHTVATGDDPTVSMSISDPQSFRQKQLAALEMLSVQLMAVNSLEQVYMPQTLRRRRR
jgi:hypothetical protein